MDDEGDGKLKQELDNRLRAWFPRSNGPRFGEWLKAGEIVSIYKDGEPLVDLETEVIREAESSGDWTQVKAWVVGELEYDRTHRDSDSGHVFGFRARETDGESAVGFEVFDLTSGRDYPEVPLESPGKGALTRAQLQELIGKARSRAEDRE